MHSNSDKMTLLFQALERKECLVIENFVNKECPGNSVVYSIAEPISINFINDCVQHFSKLNGTTRELKLSDFKIGINVVIIDGNEIANEGLHVHLSHIIAMVFDGEGVLEWEDNVGKQFLAKAKAGDCVVVPRGAKHYFTGKLSFSAFEFSDIIDYQKHHYSDIE